MAGWDDSSWDSYRNPLGSANPVDNFAESLSKKIGLDPYYTKLLLERESGGLSPIAQIGARSSAGAQGPAQVMPETAQEMAKKYGIDVSGPSGQTEAGLRYYKEQLDAFKDPAQAAAAYHSGPGRVKGILGRGGDLSKELGPVGRDYYSWFQKRIAERPTAAQEFQAAEGVAPPPATTSTAPVALQAPPQEPDWKTGLLRGVADVAEKTFELPGIKQFNEIAGAQKKFAEENVYSKVGGYDPKSTLGGEILKGGMKHLEGMPTPVKALGGAALGVGGAVADIATDPLVWEMAAASAALGTAAAPGAGTAVGGVLGFTAGVLKNAPRLAKGLATGLRVADLGFKTGMAAGFLTETPRGLAGIIENPGNAESWAQVGGGSVSGYFLAHPFMHKQAPLEQRVKMSMWDEASQSLVPLDKGQQLAFLSNPGLGTLAKIYDQVIESRWQILREKGIAPDVELPEMHLAFGLEGRAQAESTAQGSRIAIDLGHFIADASALKASTPTERSVFLSRGLSELANHELTHLLKEGGLEHSLPEEYRVRAAELTNRYKGEVISKPMDWAEYVAARENLLQEFGLKSDTAQDAFGYAYDYVTRTFGDGDLAGILAKMAKHTDPMGFVERFKTDPVAAGREINLKEVENLYQNLVNELGGLTSIFPKAYMEQISQGLERTPGEILARQGGKPLQGAGKPLLPGELEGMLGRPQSDLSAPGRQGLPPPPAMQAEGEKRKPGSLKGRRGFSVEDGAIAKVRSMAEHPEYAADVPKGELVGETIPNQREARLEGQRMKGATAKDLSPILPEKPEAFEASKFELEKNRLLNQIARQRKQASGEEEQSSFGSLPPEEQTRIVEELRREEKISDQEYGAALSRIERGWNKPAYGVRAEPEAPREFGPPPENVSLDLPFKGDLGEIPDLQQEPKASLGKYFKAKSYEGTAPAEVKKLDKGASKVLGGQKPPALRTQKGLVRAKSEAKVGALPEPSLPVEFSERVLLQALGKVRKINLSPDDRARLRAELENSFRTPFELEKMIAREAGEPIPTERAAPTQRGGTRSRIGDAVAEAIAELRAQGKDVSRFLASGEKTREELDREALLARASKIAVPQPKTITGPYAKAGQIQPVERKKTLSAEESIGSPDLQYANEWADVDRADHARQLLDRARNQGASATQGPRGLTAEEALSQPLERAPVKKKKEFLKKAKTFDLKPQARPKTLYAQDLLKKPPMKAAGELTPEEIRLRKAEEELEKLNTEPAHWTVENAKQAYVRSQELKYEISDLRRKLREEEDSKFFEEESGKWDELITGIEDTKKKIRNSLPEGLAGKPKFLGKGKTMHAAGEEKKSHTEIADEILDKYTKRINRLKEELHRPKSFTNLLEQNRLAKERALEDENKRLKGMLQPPPAPQRPTRSVTPETSTEIKGQEAPSGGEPVRRARREINQLETPPEVTNEKFPLGARVEHQEFGPGTVESTYSGKVKVKFEDPSVGTKLMSEEFIRLRKSPMKATGEADKLAADLRPDILKQLKGKLIGIQHSKDSIYRGKTWEELNEKLHELPRRTSPTDPQLLGDVVDQMRSLGVTPEEAKPSLKSQGYDPLWEKLGAPRAVITSFDLSGILRQGVIGTARMAVSHPLKLGKAIKESILSLKDEETFKKSMKAVENSPDFELLRTLGIDFARSEEQFGGARFVDGVFNKLTGGKFNFVRGSERAYTYYLNRLRYELGKHHLDTLKQLGFDDLSFKINEKGQAILSGKDSEAYRKAAEWVNIATGRGQLPQGPGELAKAIRSADKFLNFVLFSPRLMLARIATVNPLTYAGAFREMRKNRGSVKATKAMLSIHAGDLVAYAGLVATTHALLGAMFPQAQTEDDMISSDFGQIRIGNTRVDATGGLRTYFTAIARILTGETKTEYGVVKPQDQKQTIWNFIRGKFGPLPALAMTLAEGKNLVGDSAYGPLWEMVKGDQAMTPEAVKEVLRTTGGTIGSQTVVPMILTDMQKLVTENNFSPLELAMLMSGSVLGMGVSTRDTQPGVTPGVQDALRRAQVEPLGRPSTINTAFKDALGNAMELRLPYMVQKHLQENSDKDWYGILDSVVSQDSFKRMPPAAQRIVVMGILTDARQMRSPQAMREWGVEKVKEEVKKEFYPEKISRLDPPPPGFPRKKRITDVGDWFSESE